LALKIRPTHNAVGSHVVVVLIPTRLTVGFAFKQVAA
jgi:hypothetical protein